MKPFTTIAVVMLSIISLMHLLRFFFGWEVTVNGGIVPVWVSFPGFLVAAVLAFMVRREAGK